MKLKDIKSIDKLREFHEKHINEIRTNKEHLAALEKRAKEFEKELLFEIKFYKYYFNQKKQKDYNILKKFGLDSLFESLENSLGISKDTNQIEYLGIELDYKKRISMDRNTFPPLSEEQLTGKYKKEYEIIQNDLKFVQNLIKTYPSLKDKCILNEFKKDNSKAENLINQLSENVKDYFEPDSLPVFKDYLNGKNNTNPIKWLKGKKDLVFLLMKISEKINIPENRINSFKFKYKAIRNSKNAQKGEYISLKDVSSTLSKLKQNPYCSDSSLEMILKELLQSN